MSAFSLRACQTTLVFGILITFSSIAVGQDAPALPAAPTPGPRVTPQDLNRLAHLNLLINVQPLSVFQQFIDGPHTCSTEEAVIGVEVINKAKDGTSETRASSGLLIRCDGCYLMPATLTSRTLSTGQDAEQQKIYVTLNVGTPQERRMLSFPRRLLNHGMDMMALKLQAAHAPAARILLPDMLKPGDEVEVVWTAWSAETHRFSTVKKRKARLAELPKGDAETKQADLKPGEIRFTEMLDGVPGGAAIIGPEGRAVGLLPAATTRHDRFLSFSILDRITNCVVADPITDAEFALRQKKDAGEDDAAQPDGSAEIKPANGDEPKAGAHPVNDMVDVSGGPVKLPFALLLKQDDMNMQLINCIPAFKIDRYKVSNREYYAFWKSIPEKERAKKEVRAALYPIAWADAEPPFPPELDDVPVLGVPLSGAQAYARSQRKRLPTPYEWTRAAFGPYGDAAAPEWALRYMLDRQLTWRNLVLNQYAYLTKLVEPINRERQLINVDRATRNLAPLSMVNLASRSRVPFISTDEALTEACRWSYQQVMGEVARMCRDWKDPLYVIPSGSRPFDVSPFGVMDMLLNGNELVASSPELAVNGAPEHVRVRWLPKITDKTMFGRALPDADNSFYTDYFDESGFQVKTPLLSRRLVPSSARVHANSNEFCPSWNEAWVRTASRFLEADLMILPVGQIQVEPEWNDVYTFGGWGDGKVEFLPDGLVASHPEDPLAGSIIPALTAPGSGSHGPIPSNGDLSPRYVGMAPWTLAQILGASRAPNYFGDPRLDEAYGVVYGEYFSETPWYPLWSGLSPFMRQEMGRDWAKDPNQHIGAGPRSSNPMQQPADIYLLPNGFRCAR